MWVSSGIVAGSRGAGLSVSTGSLWGGCEKGAVKPELLRDAPGDPAAGGDHASSLTLTA